MRNHTRSSLSCTPSPPSSSSSPSAPCLVARRAPAAIAGVSTSPACTPSPRPQHLSHRLLALPSYPIPRGLRYCHRHSMHGELLVRGARPRLRGVLKSLSPPLFERESTRNRARRGSFPVRYSCRHVLRPAAGIILGRIFRTVTKTG
jgi:hypothetical protein